MTISPTLSVFLPPVHQPVGVGAADDQEAIEKIVDLPEAVEPSTSAPGSEEVLIDEEDPVIDFPQKLPAGVRVDDKGNVFANNTLLFTKNVSISLLLYVCCIDDCIRLPRMPRHLMYS